MIRGGALTAAAFLLAAAAPPSVERATRAALARIAARNPALHAVIAIDPSAIAQARALDARRGRRGPLFGRTVLIKDNIDVRGVATTAGSLALKDNVRTADAPLVARLRAAGAVIVGKANLSEWANIRSTHSVSGWSAIGGQTANPRAPGRSPCGSSSGSAAAVAGRMIDLAIGTETDGSVTCPAAVTGIVGLKPTVGLVSRAGIIPASASQDTAGPMAGSVRDVALLLDAIAGSDPTDPATAAADAHRTAYAAALDTGALRGVRIGVLRFATGGGPKPQALFERALETLRRAGAVLIDIADAGIDEAAIGTAEGLVIRTETKAGLAAYLATTPAGVTTRTLADLIAFNSAHAAQEMPLFAQERFLQAQATRGIGDPAYLTARAESRRMAGVDGLDRLLRDNRVVVLVQPTAPPPILIDPVNGDHWPDSGGFGSLAAVAGYPHLTVPMGTVAGLPVGLSLIGPAWSEARLLALGYAFEQAKARRQSAPPR